MRPKRLHILTVALRLRPQSEPGACRAVYLGVLESLTALGRVLDTCPTIGTPPGDTLKSGGLTLE